MSIVDPRRVEALFDEALGLEGDERARYLDEACDGERALRLEVDALLAHDTRPVREPEAIVARHLADAVANAPTLLATESDSPERALRRADPVTIDRFEVQRKLGEGAMGVVYEAYDARLRRSVALKLVRVRSEVTRARLLREAQAMAKVAHPNVVAIHEVGMVGDELYVAMELVVGETLARWLRRAPRSWSEVLALYIQTGRGLAAAHAAGIVHRDFKPDNVLVGHDGRPRVVDFGLARGRGKTASHGGPTSEDPDRDVDLALTAEGTMMGTPAFMSPEHFRAYAVDPKSDQWSFAAALYGSLFGAAPFAGDTLAALSDAVIRGALRRPPTATDVPEEVASAIVRALSVDPDARFAKVDDLLAELERPLVADVEADRARGRTKRRAASFALVLAAGASLAAVGRVKTLEFTPRGIVMLGLTGVAALAIVGVVLRRSLLASTYNRRVSVVFSAPVIGFVVHRVLALRLGASIEAVFVGDAVSMAVLSALAGMTVERWFWAGVPLALGYAFLATSLPEYAAPGFGALLMASAALGVWLWSDPRGREKK